MIQKHKAVCFTGHRNSPNTPEMRFYIKNLLEGFIVLDGADTFYAGGAKGWDNDCSDIVLEMQKEFPHIKLCLVLPYPENIQTDGWKDSEKEQYHRIVSRASNGLCPQNGTGKGCRCGNGNFVDENNDGICDNCGNVICPQNGTGTSCRCGNGNFIDENNDGICDNYDNAVRPQNGTGKGNHRGNGHRRAKA